MRLMPYLAPLQISNSDADSASVHSVSARMSAATNSQQVVVTDWTVKNPGSVVPRSCNGYESWIVEQLRKEFTEMNFDYIGRLTRPSRLDTSTRLTQHETQCNQLSTMRTSYSLLFTSQKGPRNNGIPSMIVQHEISKFYDMWKKVNGKSIKAYNKFYVSGQNSNGFFDFCDGNLDAAYVSLCLKDKTELVAYVNGGMLAQDEIDSMNLQHGYSEIVHRKQSAGVALPRRTAQADSLDEEDVFLDRIPKLQRLLDQVKDSMRRAATENEDVSVLVRSLALYTKRAQCY
ncbi:hypothetical protein GQ600_3541 [Phytophthora cactorum]|nr:hypothetical protein GQ600_3541 [Phytophthora cactorum]